MKKMLALLIGSCLSMSAFAQVIQAGNGCAGAPMYQTTIPVSMPDTNYYVTITDNTGGSSVNTTFSSTNKTSTSFKVVTGSYQGSSPCFDWVAVHN